VIDGKVDASNAGDMLTQRLLGLLPVLLHPNPQSVCVIGLGSGVTADSTLATGTVKQADLVEISPEVVKASAFFERENQHVLDKPGVRKILGDGRSHLRLTKQRYDVIVSEPSNPWMAGIASLFTREFFEEARSCLKPNGLICQWAHTYDMSPEDLRSIVRTFSSVFPESTMWLVGEGDLLLIGTNGDAIDLRGIEQRWRQGTTPNLLRDVAVDNRAAPFALLSMFAGGPAEMKRYAGDAPIQRDDRTALEFSAPRAIYGPTLRSNAATIRELADSNAAAQAVVNGATDVSWTVAGAMELKADAHVIAYDRFRRAIQLNSRNSEALAGLTDSAAGAHLEDDARALLEGLARAEPGNANVRIELSRLLAAMGNMDSAATVATEAVRLAPEDPKAAEQLASIFADAGDAERLAPVADALASKFPHRDKSLYYQATVLLLKGRAREAIERARILVARTPQDAAAQNLLGVACATEEQRDCALTAFSAALSANPRDPATYVNLGVFHLQTDPRAAAGYFGVAMTLDRTSAAARQGYADAQAAIAGAR
jgi:spermidine synthase